MTKSLFFWGIYEGNEGDETWKTLHEHFEALASQDDERVAKMESSERRAVRGAPGKATKRRK